MCLVPDGKFVARSTVKELRDITSQTNHRTLSPRAGDKLRVVFVCLLVCLFGVTTHQLTTRGNQLLPEQTEQESGSEEIHEGNVKKFEMVAASKRKALHQRLLTLTRSINRAVFLRVDERRSAIALCWNARTYRRRGPPSSITPS
jgi:hypothetical protein